MAKLAIKAGTTSKLITIFCQDSSVTTGAGLVGLVWNTSSLTAYYYREGAGSATAITLATMTLGTWATGGFVVVDGTNMPGIYTLGLPNAAIAAGANSVIVMLKGATNLAPVVLEIDLVAYDPTDAVRLGLTALPNANPGASGGLIGFGTSTGQLNPSSGNMTLVDASLTAAKIATDAFTAAKFATDALSAAAVSAAAVTKIQLGLSTLAAGAQMDLVNAPNATAITAINAAVVAKLPTALISGRIDATVGAMQTDVITDTALATTAVTEIVNAILAGIVEGTLTLQGVQRLFLAFLMNLADGGNTTTISFRDLADTKDRIVMTVDTDGNRTAVVLDAS